MRETKEGFKERVRKGRGNKKKTGEKKKKKKTRKIPPSECDLQ